MRTFIFSAGLLVAACADEPEQVGFSTGPRPMTGAVSEGEATETPTSGGSSSSEETGGDEATSTTDATTGFGPGGETGVETGSQGETSTGAETGTGETGAAGVVETVEIDAAGAQPVQVGMLGELTAKAIDGQGQVVPDVTFTWRTTEGLVLYVDGAGGLLGISEGVATVTAEADGVLSEPLEIEVVAFDPPAASFTEVRTLAGAHCAVAGCHVDGVEAGDLRWDRPAEKLWAELVEEAETFPGLMRVVADQPQDSFVIHKLALEAPEAGMRMPLGGAPLAAAEAQVFVRWILAGAPKD